MRKALRKSSVVVLGSLVMAVVLAAYACAGDASLLMSGADVLDSSDCSWLTISFTGKVRLIEAAPAGPSDELHIKLAPLLVEKAGAPALTDQESLHPPASENASVHAIELAYDASGALLSVYFKRRAIVKVSAGSEGKSIVIGVAAASRSVPCDPSAAITLGHTPDATGINAEADQRVSAIRAAIANGDIARAKVLIAEAEHAHDARYARELEELSAMMLQRAGMKVEAEQAYRRYLDRYPSGPTAARVRAKIDALLAGPQYEQNAASSGFMAPPPDNPSKPIKDGAIAAAPSITTATRDPTTVKSSDTDEDPDAWKTSQSGSTSLFYYRNEGGRDVFVPPRLQLGWDRESVYKLYQDSVVGTLDYNARFEKGSLQGRMRVSTAHDQDFIDAADSESSVYAANISLEDKVSGVSATIGRQTLYTGGVLGRFDGALASFEVASNVRLNAVAGAPVWRGSDAPLSDSTYFYGAGASLDAVKLWDAALEPGIYYLHQDASGITDREAVGASLAVHNNTASLFLLGDYDIHYGKLNDVSLMATYMFADQSLIGINADYRRAPLIFTTNALQGQPVATLSELLKIYTHAEVEQFAIDRTASSFTLDVNYTLPIGENWLFTADAYVSHLGGTAESGGVPAMIETGTDLYAYAQVTRTNLATQGDSYSAALRFGDTSYDNLYALELVSRYPILTDWSIGPSLRLGFSDSKSSRADETQIMPSLHLAYRICENATLDMEIGKKWIERDTIHGTEHETELMALAGIRYDFYTK